MSIFEEILYLKLPLIGNLVGAIGFEPTTLTLSR